MKKFGTIEEQHNCRTHWRLSLFLLSAEEAEIIFSPYSYLVDPVVRTAMQIDIENAVLIFDEAHNIEDTCREAASCDVELADLEEVLFIGWNGNHVRICFVYTSVMECTALY